MRSQKKSNPVVFPVGALLATCCGNTEQCDGVYATLLNLISRWGMSLRRRRYEQSPNIIPRLKPRYMRKWVMIIPGIRKTKIFRSPKCLIEDTKTKIT